MLGVGLGITKNASVGSVPGIVLSFATALPDNTVFTRASPAWGFNSSKDLVEVASGSPVFENFPGYGGLRMEGARTNICSNAELVDGNPWSYTRLSHNGSVQDRGLTATNVLVTSTGNNTHACFTTVKNITSGAIYTWSVIVREGDVPGGWVYTLNDVGAGGRRVYFNVLSGTIGGINAGYQTVNIENMGSGWYRLSTTMTATTSKNGNPEISICSGNDNNAYNGQDGRNIWVMHAQFEEGEFASSLIISSGALTTRVADAMINTVAVDSMDLAEGVFIAKFATMATSGSSYEGEIFSVENGAGDYIKALADHTSNDWRFRVASTTVQASADTGNGVLLQKTMYDCAIGYEANSFAGRFEGETTLTDISGTVPGSINTIQFGEGLFGWLDSFQYYDNRLANAVIEELVS